MRLEADSQLRKIKSAQIGRFGRVCDARAWQNGLELLADIESELVAAFAGAYNQTSIPGALFSSTGFATTN